MAATGLWYDLGHVGQDRLEIYAARLRDAGTQLACDPSHGQDDKLGVDLLVLQQSERRLPHLFYREVHLGLEVPPLGLVARQGPVPPARDTFRPWPTGASGANASCTAAPRRRIS